jgi:hypothetical protein
VRLPERCRTTRSVAASSCGPDDPVLLWFAGTSFLAVWLVFRDPAIDYRLVMAGAVLPDVLDGLVAGGPWVGHTLLFAVVLLVGIMAATSHRRRLRRRLLALPIGVFLHLVFDGAWLDREVFWWPAQGTSFPESGLASFERGGSVVLLELAGLAILIWAWSRFRLGEPDRRRTFLRAGRLGRDLVGR